MAQSTGSEYLKSVYYDPKRPGSFGGTESLYRDENPKRLSRTREQSFSTNRFKHY